MKKTVFAALFCLVPAGLCAQQPLLDIKVPAEPGIKVTTPSVTEIQPSTPPVAAEIIPVIAPGNVKPMSKLKQQLAAPAAAPAPKPAAAPAAPAPAPAPKPAAPVRTVAAPAPAPKPAAPVKTVAVAAPAAPAGLQAGKTHKVSGGDTLWDLSGRYYQDPYKWGKIYNANLQTVENPDRIYPMEELVIPDITEEVRPVLKPAAISGSDTFREPGVSVSEAAQPAVTAAAAPRPAPARSDELFKDSDDQLSEEMPEHHKEWASGVKIVPEGWREDGVITAKMKNDDDFLDESMAVSGEMLQIAMSGSDPVKPGDYLAVYLKGAMAYDKTGKELGLEVQPAGLAEVVSVDGSEVKARVVEAVTAITKGFIVKKK
ncbi:MAG: hypothetical protein A2X29_04800 [Elusimicrobia bacterium GWA2_64_40]|nr:MAG: hypothetical protein A2X29_04800 [Elusimicrobia bacterium GWA2_64_40]OGR63177.1 MAG: hypothetical protein A2X30_03525 [Elusimicrobia bacterium GWB2_63_16]